MRTVHIDTGREMQGGQWQVLYLLERLSRATLLAPKDSPLFAKAIQRGIEVQRLPPLMDASQFGVVHAHDSHAHTRSILARLRQPNIIHNRPLVVSRRVGFPAGQSTFSRLKYRVVDRYLAVSKFVATKLREASVPDSKIRVVYDGVPIPPKPSTLDPSRVLAVQGKFQEIGIPVHVTTNLFDDLSNSSVFLYISEMEGLGSAAIAAMAFGVPVVASGVGGLPEVVDDGRTGFIVRDGDYATPVRRLLDNPQLAAEMGAAGREKAIREFSVEKMVEATLAAYNEIL